jgi:AcrR family transcriptional regulator
MSKEAARMSTRDRIVRAAAELLEAGGRDAASTRAVSQAASVQVPTIYRQFGDMAGLLDAVASYRFAEYLQSKRTRPRLDDPVDDLRQGWNLHVEFGVSHPAVYGLMYGDPVPGVGTAAVGEADAMLRGLLQRIAVHQRLRVGVELAARVIHAAGKGVTLSLIGMRPEDRDPALSEITREAVLAAITTSAGGEPEPDGPQVATRAVALKAVLGEAADTLTEAEIRMLSEWLDRLAAPPPAR